MSLQTALQGRMKTTHALEVEEKQIETTCCQKKKKIETTVLRVHTNPRRDKDKSVLLSTDNDTELIPRIA
jgi:hypothetical protein